MPSGCPFSRPAPIIEIATYRQSRPPPADKPVNIALIPSPYAKSFERPNTTESDNRTVCLGPIEQSDDTIRKKISQRFSGPNEETDENPHQDTTFSVGLQSEKTSSTRKLDMIILPFTFLIYLSDYLQRSNISNGALYGLRADGLNNKHLYYASVLASFSITYLLISVGASIIIPNFRFPHKSLSWAVFLTSIASIIIGLASNFGIIFFCRSLIGIGGAVLGKSMEVYYSLMYTQTEMAKRMSFFIGSAVLAGALNGIIAFALGFINAPTKNWRILYFFEGGLGILLAIICLTFLPSPKFRKKQDIVSQIRLQNHESCSEINFITFNSNLFERRLVWKTLLDLNIWFSSFAYGCINLSVGSLTGYLPFIIKSFGYSERTSQIMTTWPYLSAFIMIFLVAKASDKTGIRSIFVIFMCIIGATGWTLLLRFDTISVKYFAIFLVVTGAFCPIPLTLSWTLSNCTNYTQRATSFIIMHTFGQIFTVSSNFLFHTQGEDDWRKDIGILSNLIGNVSASLAVSCLAAWYCYENRLKNHARSIDPLKFL